MTERNQLPPWRAELVARRIRNDQERLRPDKVLFEKTSPLSHISSRRGNRSKT